MRQQVVSMSDKPIIPVFDGHNDALYKLAALDRPDAEMTFLEGRDGHLDLPRARAGGFSGGLFAIYIATPKGADGKDLSPGASGYLLDYDQAVRPAMEMASLLLRLERASKGAARICRSVADIRRAGNDNALAMVMHVEGAEMIDPDFRMLDVLYAAGMRSMGPVWSRDNIFGGGVPFKYPSSPDIGPGLTAKGKELIRACNRMKIMIDLSHMTEKGFWDVAQISDAPLVASHSNVHAISAQSRNLTDKQLEAIRESDGLVGINFGVAFWRADGVRDADTPIDGMVRHLDYLIEKLGEDRVALGSDYDGTMVPAALNGAEKLQTLIEAMRKAGYGEALIRKIASENWMRVLEKTWGA